MLSRPRSLPPAFRKLVSAGHGTHLNYLPLTTFAAMAIASAGANLAAQTPTAVTVPTWRYDNTHAGQNTQETALTPENVNVHTFGKLFAHTVDSTVYAQPLYVPGLKMSDGLVHNVLFVATENDSIYAFDADSNGGANANPIWHASMLTAAHGAGAGATAVPYQDDASPDVAPTVGITGTPVINPATNTMYVVAITKEKGPTYFSRLHAINILNGAEQPGSPVVVTATVSGTGDGSAGGKLTFDALMENQRSALNYYNDYLYFGYAAHGDNKPWHGWLFSYNATTLKQVNALCLSPSDHGAGVWEAGAGMPIDDVTPGGRMFLATGNGALSQYPPFSAGQNLSMTVLDFSIANGALTPTDGFTSYNYVTINEGDYDQGSGGVLMIPDQQGTHPHVLVQAGKEGRLLVLDRDHLGGYNPNQSSNLNALQDMPDALKGGMWATPAYWNGNVYIWSVNDVAKLFKLNGGVMNTEPSSQASIQSIFPSPTFSISSNGTENGVAWAVLSDQADTFGPAVLYAFNAEDITTPIYASNTDAARDGAGTANKFSVPVVTNGKVYVATNGEIDVYGLLNSQPIAAAPVIDPDGGTFSKSQKVTLSSKTTSAEIFYTLDGSTPTPASSHYTDPIDIGTDTTLRAIATVAGYIQSPESSATFSFTGQVPQLSFRPAAGTYLSQQHVTITDANTKAKIYYTTDGSAPTASSRLYTGPVDVLVTETIKAIAIVPGLENSNVGSAGYTIQEGGSFINFGAGFASTKGLVLNGSTLATNDTRLQLTHGGLWEGGSVWWGIPIGIQAFTTNFLFQLSSAQGNGFTFTVQNMGKNALGGDSAGLGYQDITKSVAIKFNFYNYMNEGSDSTGVYTDGEPPLTPTVNIAPSGIQLGSNDTIMAQVTYNGTTLTLKLDDLVTNDTFTMSKVIDIPQVVGADTAYVGFTGGTGGLSSSQKILTWTYSTQSVAPSFSPAPGTYKSPQKVALTSKTPSAAIYYTTNGSVPTAASTRYSASIPVDASEVIRAIAISSAEGQSAPNQATYRIQVPGEFSLTAAPVNSLERGRSDTSIVTVTPEDGFIGKVTLKCSVTTNPKGAVDVPTCSITQPAAVSGTQPVKATVTVTAKDETTMGDYTATVVGVSGNTTEEKTTFAVTVTGETSKVRGNPVKPHEGAVLK